MASEMERNMERFKGENHSAFIMGYTGAVGKALVKDLNEMKIFKKVLLLGRREVPLDVGPEFEQKVVNFEDLDAHADIFKDVDVGFSCVGSTDRETMVKVDRDYVLAAGKMLKQQGGKQFSLVSSVGADQTSSVVYTRTKGEAEEGLKELGLDRVSIYRPRFLRSSNREQFRIGAAVIGVLFAPARFVSPKGVFINVETVARAMINHVVAPLSGAGPESTVYNQPQTHDASGLRPNRCGK